MNSDRIVKEIKRALAVDRNGVRGICFLPEILQEGVVIPWKDVKKALKMASQQTDMYGLKVDYHNRCMRLQAHLDVDNPVPLLPDFTLTVKALIIPCGIKFDQRCRVGFEVVDVDGDAAGFAPTILIKAFSAYMGHSYGSVPEAATAWLVDSFGAKRKRNQVWIDISAEAGINDLQDALHEAIGERIDVSQIVRCTSVTAKKSGLHVEFEPGPVGEEMRKILLEARRRASHRKTTGGRGPARGEEACVSSQDNRWEGGMTPLRIALLSDQHIDSVTNPKSWRLARAAFRAAANEGVDHIVIAGDLFDCSTAMYRDRALVEEELRALSLWDAKKLTIIVGNHDIFHTPHHGTIEERLLEWTRISLEDAGEMHEAFCSWVKPLIPAAARMSDAVYPFAKDLGGVMLVGLDTCSFDTATSSNGFFTEENDRLVRAHAERIKKPIILVSHHAPYKSPRASLERALIDGESPLGFPKADFGRLRALVDDIAIPAHLCGHLHESSKYQWGVGEQCRAFLMGRTGGLYSGRPKIGVLEIDSPQSGPSAAVSWSETKFRAMSRDASSWPAAGLDPRGAQPLEHDIGSVQRAAAA